MFPSSEYIIPNQRYHQVLEHVQFLEPGDELPVRVIHVPKTHKTPRIIAMEPVCMQYTQQALKDVIVEGIERDNLLSSFIGFRDQEPNQFLACQGSEFGSLATLDLSEASDRVVNSHVIEMFGKGTLLSESIQACRSTKADVLGEVLTLTKFASMGSALTFPIEAMYFLVLIFRGIERELKHPLSLEDIKSFQGSVRVYGDDIIVPVEFVASVKDALEGFSLKVNSHKSFWTGKFRESCGKEYYDGHDVSIVKVRRMIPASREDAQELVSIVSTRNQFYVTGYWNTARLLDSWIESLIPFPVVESTSPVMGKWSFVLSYQTDKLHRDYQSPLVKGAVLSAKYRHISTDDIWALLKFFLKRGDEPFADRRHLEVSGRPIDVTIKIRWRSPF
jgi:hypothetical protein